MYSVHVVRRLFFCHKYLELDVAIDDILHSRRWVIYSVVVDLNFIVTLVPFNFQIFGNLVVIMVIGLVEHIGCHSEGFWPLELVVS